LLWDSILALSMGMLTTNAAEAQPKRPGLKAARACGVAARRLIQYVWGNHEIDGYRACMARGQASENNATRKGTDAFTG
jgi:hypothetical protein